MKNTFSIMYPYLGGHPCYWYWTSPYLGGHPYYWYWTSPYLGRHPYHNYWTSPNLMPTFYHSNEVRRPKPKPKIGGCGTHEITFDNSIPHHIHYSSNAKPYVEVVATYLPGSNIKTSNGLLRAEEDIRYAKECWGIDFRLRYSNDWSGTDGMIVDTGLLQSDLVCGSTNTLIDNKNFQIFLREYVLPVPNRIYIFYIGPDIFPDGYTIGCAHHEFLLDHDPNKKIQVILIADDAATIWNKSCCAHELGHILFGTVPQEDSTDPTSPKNSPSNHSPNTDNVMHSPSGQNKVITDVQRSKALKSRMIQWL